MFQRAADLQEKSERILVKWCPSGWSILSSILVIDLFFLTFFHFPTGVPFYSHYYQHTFYYNHL